MYIEKIMSSYFNRELYITAKEGYNDHKYTRNVRKGCKGHRFHDINSEGRFTARSVEIKGCEYDKKNLQSVYKNRTAIFSLCDKCDALRYQADHLISTKNCSML